MKKIYIVFNISLLLGPVLVTWICLATAKKNKIIKIGRYATPYYVLLTGIFYVSYFVGEYIIPRINELLHGVHARIMGIEGFLQDFLVPAIFLVPLYYLLNVTFEVNVKTKFAGFLFLIIYYVSNYIVWALYISLVTKNIY